VTFLLVCLTGHEISCTPRAAGAPVARHLRCVPSNDGFNVAGPRSDRTQTLFHQSFSERELVAIGAHCSEVSHSIRTVPKGYCHRGTRGRDSVVVHIDPRDLIVDLQNTGLSVRALREVQFDSITAHARETWRVPLPTNRARERVRKSQSLEIDGRRNKSASLPQALYRSRVA
jgi:hypothetical protein